MSRQQWLVMAMMLIAGSAAAKSASRGYAIPDRGTLTSIYDERDWRATGAHCTPAQRRMPKASSFGCYRGYSEATYTEFSRTSRYVTMPDGTRLAVDVYRPSVKGVPVADPLPVAFDYSRYWRAELNADGSVKTYVGVMAPGESVSSIDAALKRGGKANSGVALLLAHGYVFVRAEARGTGASFGVRNGDMSGIEARDGRDVIDWIAKQPWSNGKVGMIGGSYEGMTQYLLASTAPKALRAIFPMVGTFDEYHSSWSGTGVMKTYGLAWLAREAKRDGVQKGKAGSVINPTTDAYPQVPPADEDKDGALRAAARKERLADPDAIDPTTYFTRQSPEAAQFVKLLGEALGSSAPGDIMEAMYSPRILADLMARTPGLRAKINALHFYRDASAMLTAPQDVGANNLAMLAPRIRASGIAVYDWGGWRDFATVDTLLWDANLSTPKKLTMGPWSHTPNEPGDLREAASRVLGPIEQLRWLDYWLKGIDNGIMREPAVTYAVLGNDDRFGWRQASRWPGDRAPHVAWTLSPTAGLIRGTAKTGVLVFTVDAEATLGDHTRYHDAIGLGPTQLNDLARHATHGAVAFTSSPLVADLDITGGPIVRLQIVSSTPDAYLNAYLERIQPDGTIQLLSDGVMRASHRVLGTPGYNNLGQPFSDSRRAVVDATPPLDPRKPSRIEFELQPIAAHFPKGSRLRLVVAGADAGTNLSIPQSPPTRLGIRTGGANASALLLPQP